MITFIVSIFFLSYSAFAFSHVQQESLFAQTFIFKGFYDVDMTGTATIMSSEHCRQEGNVLFIRGIKSFVQFVLQSKKPVVLKVFDSNFTNGVDQQRKKILSLLYQEVAGELVKNVTFVAMDISYQENINIIARLGIKSLVVPLFLFFDQQALLLPPLVLLPAVEFVSKEKMTELKKNFIEYITNQFSSRKKKINTSSRIFSREQAQEKSPVSKNSMLDKIGRLSEKMGQFLTGLTGLSSKEVKAYSLAKKRG